MPKIRVLVVDDAVVVRRMVSAGLAEDPAIEVVGAAANGKIALAMIPQVNPDLVVLDVEMPEMDGLATLRELRRLYSKLPVIMFSGLTEPGAVATLDALTLGATDYVTKPSGAGGTEAAQRVIRDELAASIKAICGAAAPTAPLATKGRWTSWSAAPAPVEVIAIGASTGGPNALADLFSGLPADLPVPLVVVQHMPPVFTRLLAERLSSRFAIPVEEGRAGGLLRPGHAWIAPGNYHMAIAREGAAGPRLVVHQEPPENSCRPAADVLFRSVARTFGPSCLAVVLTGMGQDGLRGCEAIKEAGGQVIAQDEATSVVWGMPGFVARAGLADEILPLPRIAEAVLRRVARGRTEGRR